MLQGVSGMVMTHSDGAARRAILDFIAIGMDAQTTLPFGPEDEVRRVARERMDVLWCTGGYTLAPTHNVQADMPPANIVVMYAEAESARSGKGDLDE